MSLLHQLEAASHAGANSTIEVLRNIKNLVTGQEIRKIEYIRAGIVPILSKLLTNSSEIQPKDKRCALWTECAHIVSVIAHGGPSFVEPILRSEIPALLVQCLNTPMDNKCTLTVLRCLNSICDNLPLASSASWPADKTLTKLLQTAEIADSLTKMSSVTGTGLIEQRISDSALALINKTAYDAKSKTLLVRAGLLDSLSRRLASFILAEALAIPHARSQVDDEILSILQPPSPSAHLSPILETISLLIDDSSTLALDTFLRNPVLVKILDWSQSIAPQTARSRPIWGTPKTALQRTTYLEFLLPSVPEADAHKDLSFPPLGQPDTTPRRLKSATRSSRDARLEEAVVEIEHDTESPVIPYLMVVVRSCSGRRRCAAAHLLSTLYSFGAVGVSRAKNMAALLVPILVDMIEKAYKTRPTSSNERTLTGYPCYWLAPSTLARLVRDNVILQVAAHEAQAIQALTSALKANFEKAKDKPSSLWWPRKLSGKTTEGLALQCLGLGGPDLDARHEMHFREGLLQALASIAPSNDTYRTAICDQGAMSQIILALAPFVSTVVQGKSEDSLVVQGNSAQTLLAACSTVRALTRSPTALRTKLVDADVAKSVVKLLHCNEVEVRIAATAIVANLAHDFSPMKPTVSEPEIVQRLCEQAHSAHPRLRFESIFALKSLVTRSSNKLKKMIVDGLGASWIAHLLVTDPRDVPYGEIIGSSDKEYRKGTNVRIQSEDMDVEMDYSETASESTDHPRNTHTLHDDFEILEQLLGFVRNLFTGDNSSEIIEHFLAEIGYEELVQILIERLKDRSRQSSSSYRKTPSVTTPSPPRGITEHTMYILVHLSAADPKWKTLIIQSDTLLKTIHTHFSSPDEKIRVACCWATINLLWTTNSENNEVAVDRARILVRRGFLETCKRLERGDESVDVRERAKTVIQCFGKLGAG